MFQFVAKTRVHLHECKNAEALKKYQDIYGERMRTAVVYKAMKSNPLLGQFFGSEFWGFSVDNIAMLGVFMFKMSDNSQLCIDSQYSSK